MIGYSDEGYSIVDLAWVVFGSSHGGPAPMIGFSKPREDLERKLVRERFDSLSNMLRRSQPAIKMMVGHHINVLDCNFTQSFGGLSSFLQLPPPEKSKYISDLSAFEDQLFANEPIRALGVALFRMWLSAKIDDDADLAKKFARELAFFSKLGDPPLR